MAPVSLRSLSLCCAFAFSFGLCGAAQAQTTLPTTGYNLHGAANALASAEENAIAQRLRTLREGNRLAPQRIATANSRPFTDLQPSREALHDLRVQPSAKTATTFGTQDSYPLKNQAVYRNPLQPKPADTAIEDGYNQQMRNAGIGAGAANATTRETVTRRQRIVLNQADRAGRDLVDWAGEVGGSGNTYASAKGHLPRYSIDTSPTTKRAIKDAAGYRGQPLSSFGREPTRSITPSLPPEQASSPSPVIYSGHNETPRALAAPQAPMPALAPVAPAPTYATPAPPLRKAQPSSYSFNKTSKAETSDYFPQMPSNAMITGTREGEPAAQTTTPKPPDAAVSYGAKAVPLRQGASIDTDRRWGFFISGAPGYGNGEFQTSSAKARTVRQGFTAGVDYRLEEQSFVGLALTYAHSNFTTAPASELSGDSVSLSLYGTTDYAKNAYAMGYLSLGYHSLESDRAAGGLTAKASPDGFQFNAKAETGYDLFQGDFKFGPYAGLRLASANFGSYSESGAGSANLKVKSLSDFSAIATLGAGGSVPVVMSNGGVLLPSLRLGYNHELGDERSTIKAEFVDGSAASFTTKGKKKSRDWINLTPALTAALANDWTFAAQYEHDFFRDNSRENIFNLTAAYKW